MKCNHCGSGDSHYDYNEILEIEKENLRLIEEIEETRSKIKRLNQNKRKTYYSISQLIILSVLSVILLAAVIGCVLGMVFVDFRFFLGAFPLAVALMFDIVFLIRGAGYDD